MTAVAKRPVGRRRLVRSRVLVEVGRDLVSVEAASIAPLLITNRITESMHAFYYGGVQLKLRFMISGFMISGFMFHKEYLSGVHQMSDIQCAREL